MYNFSDQLLLQSLQAELIQPAKKEGKIKIFLEPIYLSFKIKVKIKDLTDIKLNEHIIGRYTPFYLFIMIMEVNIS